MKSGSKANLNTIQDIIDLYADRNIVNLKTARNLAFELAFQTGYNKKEMKSCIK